MSVICIKVVVERKSRKSWDILSVKKEVKLAASEIPGKRRQW